MPNCNWPIAKATFIELGIYVKAGNSIETSWEQCSYEQTIPFSLQCAFESLVFVRRIRIMQSNPFKTDTRHGHLLLRAGVRIQLVELRENVKASFPQRQS